MSVCWMKHRILPIEAIIKNQLKALTHWAKASCQPMAVPFMSIWGPSCRGVSNTIGISQHFSANISLIEHVEVAVLLRVVSKRSSVSLFELWTHTTITGGREGFCLSLPSCSLCRVFMCSCLAEILGCEVTTVDLCCHQFLSFLCVWAVRQSGHVIWIKDEYLPKPIL